MLAAAFTPLCWIGVLIASKQIRKTGLAGPGLSELWEQLERYAWAAGGFLALLVANVLGDVGSALLRGLLLAGLVVLISWLVLRAVVRQRSLRG
jgi:hypothetical protein